MPYLPQHCLYFLPLPQEQGSLRPTLGPIRTGRAFSTAAAAWLTMSLGRGWFSVAAVSTVGSVKALAV